LTGVSVIAAFVSEYNAWYANSLLPRVDNIDRVLNPIFVWSGVFYIALYWVLLLDNLRTASSPDARRRLQVLLAGSVVGLGSILIIFGLLPYLGIANPGDIRWLLFLVIVLMLLFPLTLAYVVIVQRAMDVRVVIRQGLQYALARRGVLILQILLSAALFTVLAILMTSHSMNPLGTVAALAGGFWAIFLLNGAAQRLAVWVDRRFFREAYNAEQILNRLAESVSSMVELAPLLKTVATRIAEALHISEIAVFLSEQNVYRPAFSLGYSQPELAIFDERASTVQELSRRKEPLPVYFDDPRSWAAKVDGTEAKVLRELDAQLLLPLARKDQLLGFITLGPKYSEAPYSTNDVNLLQSVASQTALAVENSRLTSAIANETAEREIFSREMAIARDVQRRLLPQFRPQTLGVEYAASCRSAQEVGGDYYDYFALPGETLAIAIGDVAGKGIPAALLMGCLQASLRAQTVSEEPTIERVVTNINSVIYATTPVNRYATFLYAQYEPALDRLTYVNAGHNPPILLRRCNGAIETIRLDVGGLPVGLVPSCKYVSAQINLCEGDLLILFTDGISEAENPAEDEWGEDKLIGAAIDFGDTPPSEMIERLFQAADCFAAGAAQHDDMTIMVFRFGVNRRNEGN